MAGSAFLCVSMGCQSVTSADRSFAAVTKPLAQQVLPEYENYVRQDSVLSAEDKATRLNTAAIITALFAEVQASK